MSYSIARQDVLLLIESKVKSYQWAKDNAGTDHDRRKYQEGIEALQSLAQQVENFPTTQPKMPPPPKAEPTLIKCGPGEYNTPGREWSIIRTEPNGWWDHNPDRPWAIIRNFGSGGQVEARARTFKDARTFLGV